MKKIARIVVSAAMTLSILVVPTAAYAESTSTIVVDDPTASTALPATGATETPTTPTTPNSGAAPLQSKLAQNAAVFIGGSTLGAALGFGVITLRRKQNQQ